MKKIFILMVLLPAIVSILTDPLHAARKTIYIKPFAIVQGLPKSDPMGNHFKDYLAEYIIERGGYSIITDDEVRQVIEQESLKMTLDACYDDSCIKKLMKSIKTDYIIYGTVSYIENKYYISAKVLDRTSGSIILSRVKTVKFTRRDIIDVTAKAMGQYLLTGDDDALKSIGGIDKSGDVSLGRKGEIVNRYPLIRIGTGSTLSNDDVKEYYNLVPEEFLIGSTNIIMIDLFLYRYRYRESTGFDFFVRMIRKEYDRNNITKDLYPVYGIDSNANEIYDNRLVLIGGSAGIRYITGTYHLGSQWQLYASMAVQRFSVEKIAKFSVLTEVEPQGSGATYTSSYGIVAGAGAEIAFWSYLGLFLEINYGHNKADITDKKGNIDGLNLVGGISFRVGDLL